nr:reverse transcriptase domain-containing protein [Tanacetum cinerariifolium]
YHGRTFVTRPRVRHPEDEPEPHPAYDFFTPGPLPGYAGNLNNNNGWLEADDYLLGELEAIVNEPMVVLAIEEVAELVAEVKEEQVVSLVVDIEEEQMAAPVMDIEEDLAALFGKDDDFSDDDSEGVKEEKTISTQDQKPQRKAGSGSKFLSNNLTMKPNLSKFQSLRTILTQRSKPIPSKVKDKSPRTNCVNFSKLQEGLNLPSSQSLRRSYFPPANTIPRHSRRKNTSIVESEIQTNATMADNRTMAQMLHAPIEGYEDAIVVPPINANNFELKQTLINLVQSNQFTGRQDPHNHLRFFNKVTSTFRHLEVPNTTVKLLLFPFSLEGEARIWLDKEPSRSILTWRDLVSKFINQFFPPSKTTYLRNEITNFLQKSNETFNEA